MTGWLKGESLGIASMHNPADLVYLVAVETNMTTG